MIDKELNQWQGDGALARMFVGYIRSIDHPVKLRIVFFIAKLFFGKGVPMKYATEAKIAIHPNDFIGWSILKSGSYEPSTISLMHALLSNGGTFIDVGANFDLLSSVAASIKGVSVHSIEAHSGNFERLRETRRSNSICKIWMLYECAISDTKTFVDIEEYKVGNSGMHRVSSDSGKSGLNTFRVACRTLNELVNNANITSIEVLKIDVEGYEFQVLQGLDFVMPRRPKNIILEFTDYGSRFGYSRKDVYEHLSLAGYELFDVNKKRKNSTDDFTEDNALFVDARTNLIEA